MITVHVSNTEGETLETLSVLKAIELTLTQMHDVTVVKPTPSPRFCRYDILDVDEYTPFTVQITEG